MKYFFDTEFHEYEKQAKVLGMPIGRKNFTIDLISIGIVAEDGREYYAICNEFDLRDAWNSYQDKMQRVSDNNAITVKEYWLRENVLKPIFKELLLKLNAKAVKQNFLMGYGGKVAEMEFTIDNLRFLLHRYGKSRETIAKEVLYFVSNVPIEQSKETPEAAMEYNNPEFYAYYGNYDWVVFMWIWGKMINKPDGFPMFQHDLKSMFDSKAKIFSLKYGESPENWVKKWKKDKTYPTQDNAHNALEDAKWNKELFYFIQKLD